MKPPGTTGYSHIREERQPVAPVTAHAPSVAATAIAEASKATVSVSLLLIVALAAGAFYAGRASPPPELVAQIAASNERSSANAATMAEQLKQMAELQKQQAQALRDLQELARTTNTEVQFMSSYYKVQMPRTP